jgi:cytoplasmic iron level regulating protein YaaA (DUF328/UPF0246 family)
MKALVSPAKSLELTKEFPTFSYTQPEFLTTASELNMALAKLSKAEIVSLMHLSDKLADLNYNRFQEFNSMHTTQNSRPAIFTFNGDVYDGIDAFSIDPTKYKSMQHSLRILSGLYGVLKPFDLMQAYRLEMGTKFGIHATNSLYEVWQDKVTDALNKELNSDELVVNLASNEYFKVLDHKQLKGHLVSPVFKDFKNGQLKIISFYAKKARGLMYRYLLNQDIQDLNGLIGFDYAGYKFSAQETKDENSPVFIR